MEQKLFKYCRQRENCRFQTLSMIDNVFVYYRMNFHFRYENRSTIGLGNLLSYRSLFCRDKIKRAHVKARKEKKIKIK